ncbi:MAG: carboxynorspermidine decarboxylase [bacterium]
MPTQKTREEKFKNLLKLKSDEIPTPCFVVDESLIEENLKILDSVQKKTGCKILLALKGFAMFKTFPLISRYLGGICASGVNEARLGYEEFGKEVHSFSPAYTESEMKELIKYSDHIVFNSFFQWDKFKPLIKNSGKNIECGIRINPEKSPKGVKYKMYDPCSENSRLGIILKNFKDGNLDGISGLHFHVLCEQSADALEEVLAAFEQKFSSYIKKMRWVNFGGGHLITQDGYDVDKLCKLITDFKNRYPNIEKIYLEPGEASVLNTGILTATVLDIIHNKHEIAVLDISAEVCLLDMLYTKSEPEPYRPEIIGAEQDFGKLKYDYILGGISCAAGDVIGEYSFPEPLKRGDRLIFTDAAHYSMVKTTTFNGINPPSIAIYKPKTDSLKVVRRFGYEDYKNRLS